MAESEDKTRELLAEAVRELYGRAARSNPDDRQNYLQGGDGAFLGTVTDNRYEPNAITNRYGPYGSRYSPTSIYNPYSSYGSVYSNLSVNSVYASNPPVLYLRGRQRGRVSKNLFVRDRVDTDVFLHLLESDVRALLRDQIPDSVAEAGHHWKSYLLAADGTFLGSLSPQALDRDSIFNKYGAYGSEFSPTSIFNKFGTYGSKFSSLSPFNAFSNTPPKAYVNGEPVAYVTVNKYVQGVKVDPNELKEWARHVVRR